MTSHWGGKTCLVTGGTRGIGKAIVEAFAAEGARVFTCSRNEQQLDESLAKWKEMGYDVQGCVCDVGKKEDLQTMIQKVEKCFDGQLTALVNNAGVSIRKKAIEYEETDYDYVMDINLRSCYDISRKCHSMLCAGRPSSVVLIGSIASARVIHSGCIYAMTKASLRQLAMNLACEWALDGIRVNCIAPGYIDTSLLASVKEKERFLEVLIQETPMKRIGKPEEIASPVLYISGPGASFMTGQTLYIDGGFTVHGIRM